MTTEELDKLERLLDGLKDPEAPNWIPVWRALRNAAPDLIAAARRLADTEQANRVLRDEFQQMQARAEQAERELAEERARTAETLIIEQTFSLYERFSAVKTALHAYDYIQRTTRPFSSDRMSALELLGDGIRNAIDSRATGREFRTMRHSYLARTDPQHHPLVAKADRRCQDCGAVNPAPFTHCWQHRPIDAARTGKGGAESEKQ